MAKVLEAEVPNLVGEWCCLLRSGSGRQSSRYLDPSFFLAITGAALR
jgi:hypothetical protein